jgi:CPA1 family monovalent cation:H+ antiporter
MPSIELILGLLAVAVVLALVANYLRLATPIVLCLGGVLLGLQPGMPPVVLDPHLVLTLFLPPLLYASAFHMRWRDFWFYIRPISMLAVGLVLFTSVAVAWVCHAVIGLPWAIGFAIGAIVSPPDAVAAIAVTKRLKIPHRLQAILEGESLVNDASALIVYRMAIVAVATGHFSLAEAVGDFFVASAGGVAIGLAVGWLVTRLHPLLDRLDLADSKLSITMTLLTPFAAYLPAEWCHVSGVLAVVTAGLFVGHRCGRVFSQELYIEARAVWEWIDFLLNSLIFILIGLQLRHVLDDLKDDFSLWQLTGFAAMLSAVVIVVRLIWVFPAAYLPRVLMHVRDREPLPAWSGVFVVGWTGLRGVVSLAAAMAIPVSLPDKTPFPHRDLILFLTFWVIFVTLVGQGLTLPWIIKALHVDRLAPTGNRTEPKTVEPRLGHDAP